MIRSCIRKTSILLLLLRLRHGLRSSVLDLSRLHKRDFRRQTWLLSGFPRQKNSYLCVLYSGTFWLLQRP